MGFRNEKCLWVLLGLVATALGGLGCEDSESSDSAASVLTEEEIEEGNESGCRDLSGTWVSHEYEALSVNLDGTHSTLSELTMTLEVIQDDACHFHGVNTWSNGTLGGTEYVAGVLHNDGTSMTLVEVSAHPEGGSTARIHAKWVDGQLEWEYAGHSEDGTRAVVFGAILSRDGGGSASSCPNIVGTWASETYEAFTVQGEGSHGVLEGLSMTFEVEHQSGCTFRGVNSWTNGEIGGSEPVAGLIHADGEHMSIVEFGEHPEGGSTGRILARVKGEQMEWEYAGIDVEKNRGVVFGTLLSRGEDFGERAPCPNLLGDWNSEVYEALTLGDGGTSGEIEGLTMTLTVEHQEDCTFRGINAWSNGSAGGSEPVAGVVHADGTTLTMVEVGDHPEGGSSAMIMGIVSGDNEMHWEYGGVSEGGQNAVVFSTILTR